MFWIYGDEEVRIKQIPSIVWMEYVPNEIPPLDGDGNFNLAYKLNMWENEEEQIKINFPNGNLQITVNYNTTTQQVADEINKSFAGMRYIAEVNSKNGVLELFDKNDKSKKIKFSIQTSFAGEWFDIKMPEPDGGKYYIVNNGVTTDEEVDFVVKDVYIEISENIIYRWDRTKLVKLGGENQQ